MRFNRLYPLIIGLLFHFSSIAQPLNGNYTVGGTSPNYATLTAATSALNANGISGPVTFNIRSGIYNEKMVLTAVIGSSQTNTITFKSETNNPADVKITDEHTSDANLNYTVYINGADNIYFRYVTLEARKNPSTNNPCRVVNIFNDANNIRLEDNIIKSYPIPTNDIAMSAITCGVGGFSAGTFRDNDSLFVLRNSIVGGYCGLVAYGQGRDLTTYRSISENQLTDQTTGGIDCNSVNECFITKNSITQTQSSGSFIGMKVFDAEKTINVSSNAITISNGITGIEFYIVMKTNGYKRIISNNAIKITGSGGTQAVSGIRTMQTHHLLVAHNTIDLNRTSTNIVMCLYMAGGDTINIQNNILLNRTAGYSYYSAGLPKLTSSNNNHFSQTGSAIASVNSIVYAGLTDLQSGLSIDANSYNLNPYLSGQHTLIPSGQQIFGNGIPIADVTQDFFGTTRSVTAPCIGAYEGNAPLNNATISYDNFTDTAFCPEQNYPLTVRITNLGQTPLTSAEIHFNGAVLNWTGNLGLNQESADIPLGNWYIPRVFNQTLPGISVHLPNGQPDGMTANDTLFVTIYPRLTGNYTVGGSSADFTTITEASNRLTQNGVCSHVIMNVTPGNYPEAITFQNIDGLSATSSVTIKSLNSDSSSVILDGTAPSITLNNLSYFNIKNITISGTNTFNGDIFITVNGGHHLSISNNQLINGGILVNSGSNPTHHLNIQSNRINNAFSQITQTYCRMNVVLDGSTTNPISDVDISNNVMEGLSSRDLYVNNTNKLTISKNMFSGQRGFSSVDLDTCVSVLIFKNKTSLRTNHYAFDFYKCTATTPDSSFFHTNMVLGLVSASMKGVLLIGCTNLGIYSNTIQMPSGVALYVSTGNSGVNCRNNIFHSLGNRAVHYINVSTTSSIQSRHNNLASTGSSPIMVNSSALSITVFQQTYSNEFESILAIPLYISSTDLHIGNTSVAQDGTGIYVPGIIDDIDGDIVDSAAPDFGADQYVLNYSAFDNNIRIIEILNPDESYCSGDDTLKILVTNVSDDIVNYFTVKWTLFGTQMNQFVFNQVMNPGDTIEVPVGMYPFNSNTMYSLNFNISLPNNTVDGYYLDNTKSIQYSNSNGFEIGQRQFEECSSDKELYIPQFPRNSVLWSTGAVTDSIIVSSPGTYSVTVQFDGGCSITQSITIN